MYPQSVPHCCSVLGVTQRASEKEIRLAYKKLVLKFHPDKNGGSKELNHAREFLTAERAKRSQNKSKSKAKRAQPKSTPSKGKEPSYKKPSNKKAKGGNAKAKRLKAKSSSPKYETMAEDIGPKHKAWCPDYGVEMTLEEHEQICGCELIGMYEDEPEVPYSYDDEEDGEYLPEDRGRLVQLR